MLSIRSLSIAFVFGVILIQHQLVVNALQCYVCEDCNEFEDLKELHICGEISMPEEDLMTTIAAVPFEVTTIAPIVLPQEIPNENKPDTAETSVTTKKPAVPSNSEEYVYDSLEETDAKNRPQAQKEQASPAFKTITIKPTAIPSSAKVATTTQLPTTKIPTKATTADLKPNSILIATTIASKTTQKPTIQLSDEDYVEYEDFNSVERNSNPIGRNSLLKIVEPVCYMFKYKVNNTILTNRGCTNYIESNRELTCQSLFNGAPKSDCRLCSTNGCNKFLSSDDYDSNEDHLPPYFNQGTVSTSYSSLLFYIGFSCLISIIQNF